MALFKPAPPAATEVNRTTDYPVAPVNAPCESGGDDSHCRNRRSNRKIDLIHHRSSTTKLWRLCPWPLHGRRTPKLTCPSPTTGARGLPRFHAGDKEPMYTQDEFASFTRKQEEEAQVVPFAFHTPTPCQPERNDIAHSLLQTTMEPLPHGLWSCSSKSLTGRTGLQTEGRFSLLEPLEIQP